MADHEPGLPTWGNALLDIVGRSFPFPRDSEKIKVRMRKHERIFFGSDGDQNVYFPIDCLFSLRCSIKSGYTAEFGQIGKEGIVGINSLFGDCSAGSEAIALTSGHAYRIGSAFVRAAFEGSTDFRRTILAYMEGQMRESAQRIICNKQHSITEQVCRTLLMASDRLGSQTLGLTHEQLAIAIGCRREAASISAGKLQSDGVIRYGYGKITITDRVALEYRSCECYPVIREGFAKFMAAKEGDSVLQPDAGFENGRKA